MKTESPMALDDSLDTGAAAPTKDNDGVPYCQVHHCRMKQTSGGKKESVVAYYSCCVKGCDEKAKMIKTSNPGVVPPQPLCCPRCKPDQICERDKDASTAASVILRCPRCSWKSGAMPVPQLAAAHFAARKPSREREPNIGDR